MSLNTKQHCNCAFWHCFVSSPMSSKISLTVLAHKDQGIWNISMHSDETSLLWRNKLLKLGWSLLTGLPSLMMDGQCHQMAPYTIVLMCERTGIGPFVQMFKYNNGFSIACVLWSNCKRSAPKSVVLISIQPSSSLSLLQKLCILVHVRCPTPGLQFYSYFNPITAGFG